VYFLKLANKIFQKPGIYTEVPGSDPILLKHYYNNFLWYYPKCELGTKNWFVQNAQRDWVCIDAGANVGIYTILLSKLSPSGFIYSFEPTETIKMLTYNCNYHKLKNVKIVNKALGAKSGLCRDKIYKIWGLEPKKQKYFFISIDDFISEEKITKIDAIKIDVDSFDFEVLQGAQKTMKRFNPWLVVELNHALSKRGQSNSEAFLWLRREGYTSALVIDHENFILKKGSNFSGKEFKLVYPDQ